MKLWNLVFLARTVFPQIPKRWLGIPDGRALSTLCAIGDSEERPSENGDTAHLLGLWSLRTPGA